MNQTLAHHRARWIPAGIALACGLALASVPQSADAVASTTAVRAAGFSAPSNGDAERRAPATKFGTGVWMNSGETYKQAFQRSERAYGDFGVVRIFYSGAPAPWSAIKSNVGDTPASISFKYDPTRVLAGDFDADIRQWFRDAPTTYRTWWTYYHEPEDNIESGQFTAPEYRAAWRHLAAIADSVGNKKLRATLVLMGWSTNPQSHRNWRDYYPGEATIDVLGWDCYNLARKVGRYGEPSSVFDGVISASRNAGKPFGIAELGSLVVPEDGGVAGRATWLRDVGRYLRAHDARFVTYFDAPVGGEFRLLDDPSQTAWRGQVSR